MDYEEFAKLSPRQRANPFLVSLFPCLALFVVLLLIAFVADETMQQMHFRAVCAEMDCP
jgi:hypothetical protein